MTANYESYPPVLSEQIKSLTDSVINHNSGAPGKNGVHPTAPDKCKISRYSRTSRAVIFMAEAIF